MNLLTLYTLCAGRAKAREGWQEGCGRQHVHIRVGGSQEEATTSIGVQQHPT